jgi:hypothetical protein
MLLCIVPLSAYAKSDTDRTQFGRDIRIEAGQRAGDVTCFNCSIHVLGQVSGDVTTFHGNIILEPGARVAGDVTSIWGNLRVDNETRVGGDATAIGGTARVQPQASVMGDRTSLEGSRWILAILLSPVVCLGLLVGFIIWLVQHRRRQARPVTLRQGAAG